jgi:hypothetical protein
MAPQEPEMETQAKAGPASPAVAKSANEGRLATFIPYRNPRALLSYYCGIFALAPVVGLVLGPVAILFGIMAVYQAGAHPGARGAYHAVFGIICGLLTLMYHPVLLLCWLVGFVKLPLW